LPKPQKKKILPRWPADKVERWALDRLVPYARNARTHTDEQVDQVAASIREWGWTNPVLVDEAGGIIAGHCRVLAATKLGLAEVPVIIAAGWSEAQKRAYVLADNQLALNAGWNPELLKLELGELQGLGFDLGVIGFDDAQLAAIELFGSEGVNDPFEEWVGMPEFQQNNAAAFKTIVVHFKDAEAVDLFANLIGQRITPKTRFVWYPQAEIERYVDKQYTTAAPPPT
jgi:hypothetical protein